jgi:hypothetical protein
MLINVFRPFYPSQALPSEPKASSSVLTPSLAPSSADNRSFGVCQDDDLVWGVDTLILKPRLDSPDPSHPASPWPRKVTLTTSLRRPYYLTWQGMAEFSDGALRPIVAKFAFMNFSLYAREVHIHKVLASRSEDVRDSVAPPFYGSYMLSDGSVAVTILGYGGTCLPTSYGEWDFMSFERLEQLQV